MSFSGKGQNNDIRPDSFLLAPAVQYCLFSVLAVPLQSGPFHACAGALIFAARSSSCSRLILAQSLRPG